MHNKMIDAILKKVRLHTNEEDGMNEGLLAMQEKYKKQCLFFVIAIIVLLCYWWQPLFHHWIITVVMLFVIIYFFGAAKENRGLYKKACHDLVFEQTLSSYFTSIKRTEIHDASQKVAIIEEINHADLNFFEKEWEIHPQAILTAQYKELDFELYEYNIMERKTNSKGEVSINYKNSYWFMKVDLPNEFLGEIQVHTFVDPFKGYKKRLEKIEFASTEFSKTFTVYATSKMDAYRLIKAPTILRFLKVYERTFAKDFLLDLDFCFLDGKFYISRKAIPIEVQVPFFKPIDFEKAKKPVKEMALWIKNNIEDFNLCEETYITGRIEEYTED